ncbi:cytochrome P450 [Nesidiocoris tenuis]|uniref:Cytochrome P450 n=1 Tax=Nesidiocoris tenuis TaxID=355587 RepID=A0ABN7AUL9_9HEMI|nr:cytochrome P450 [Nesidiocoris tenuis]
MATLWIILSFLLAVCAFIFHVGYFGHISIRLLKKMRKLRGPWENFIFGSGLTVIRLKEYELLPYYSNILNEFKGFMRIWIFAFPYVVTDDPDFLEVVFNSKNNDKGFEYSYLHPWLKEGLLVSTGRKWFERRKTLTPSFHFKILGDNVSSIENNAKIFVKKMLAQGSSPFNVEAFINSCTLQVICQTAMGFGLDDTIEESDEIICATKRVKEAIFARALSLYSRYWMFLLMPIGRRFLRDVKTLHHFTRKVIAKRRKELMAERSLKAVVDEEDQSTGYKKPQPFLDTLLTLDLSGKAKLTDADIQEEVDTFMFEGADTTTTALTMVLYELGMHQDIQEKVYKEQLNIFGTSDREVNRDDLSRMDYLEMCIKEALRLYPPVSYMSRRVNEDTTMPKGDVVPKDAFFAILPYIVHRNPKYFTDPERFIPERFTPEECVKRHPFAYIPFSAGPRNCIGQKFAMMEMKVVVSRILRNVKITSITKRSEIKLTPTVILRSMEPILVTAEPR